MVTLILITICVLQTGSLLPELMTQSSQSQLTAATTSRPGSVVPSSLMPLPGQTSTSPGLGTGKGGDVTAGGGGAGATPSPNKIVSQNLNGTRKLFQAFIHPCIYMSAVVYKKEFKYSITLLKSVMHLHTIVREGAVWKAN